jgi:hypothetical protein
VSEAGLLVLLRWLIIALCCVTRASKAYTSHTSGIAGDLQQLLLHAACLSRFTFPSEIF